MAKKRASYRNPLISALLFALLSALLFSLLYFLIHSGFFWAFRGKLPFADFYNFDWMEGALGTITMFVLAFIVELVRNLMGRRRSATAEPPPACEHIPSAAPNRD